MVVFVAIGAAITLLNAVFEFEGLRVATGAVHLAASGPAGSNGQVLLLLDTQHYGFLIAQIFFGLWLVPLGYLSYTSGMFPRALGVLLVAGGACYLVGTFAAFLIPGSGQTINTVITIPSAIAEVCMVVYLLVIGVRTVEPDDLSSPPLEPIKTPYTAEKLGHRLDLDRQPPNAREKDMKTAQDLEKPVTPPPKGFHLGAFGKLGHTSPTPLPGYRWAARREQATRAPPPPFQNNLSPRPRIGQGPAAACGGNRPARAGRPPPSFFFFFPFPPPGGAAGRDGAPPPPHLTGPRGPHRGVGSVTAAKPRSQYPRGYAKIITGALGVPMCSPAVCDRCKKITWTGCGQHVEQALAGVPPENRCTCPLEPASTAGRPRARATKKMGARR